MVFNFWFSKFVATWTCFGATLIVGKFVTNITCPTVVIVLKIEVLNFPIGYLTEKKRKGITTNQASYYNYASKFHAQQNQVINTIK